MESMFFLEKSTGLSQQSLLPVLSSTVLGKTRIAEEVLVSIFEKL